MWPILSLRRFSPLLPEYLMSDPFALMPSTCFALMQSAIDMINFFLAHNHIVANLVKSIFLCPTSLLMTTAGSVKQNLPKVAQCWQKWETSSQFKDSEYWIQCCEMNVGLYWGCSWCGVSWGFFPEWSYPTYLCPWFSPIEIDKHIPAFSKWTRLSRDSLWFL